MQTVSIDAGVLAFPQAGVDAEIVYNYVEALLDWRRLLDEPWISVYVSERAPEILFEEGLYPLRDALHDAFKKNGISEYDVNTVSQVTERLLRITPSFEAFFRVRDVLVDNFEAEPDLLSLTIGQNMAADLGRCVLLIALLRKHCTAADKNISLIVKNSPASGQIVVRATIHDIDHERDDMEAVPNPPDMFEGSVFACQNFRGLLLSIDEASIWQAATDSVGKELAIRIAVYKSRLMTDREPEWDDNLNIRLGIKFLEMADAVCQVNPDELVPKLLRSITETIGKINLQATHALRTNQSGGSPQRRRNTDGAKAWRRDIDYEYHLHYWECPDGIVELASAGTHNDFSIPG